MRVKNWKRFQHFSDRRPLWIKLYREVLDQRDINLISDCAFRVLIGCWLLASEDEAKEGNLPPVEDVAFRLRIDKRKVINALRELEPWIYQDDINSISSGYHVDILETEKEKRREEKEHSVRDEEFNTLWSIHPYGSKQEAREAYRRVRGNGTPPIADLEAALRRQVDERAAADASGEFAARLPHLCRWLRHKRWEDAPLPVKRNAFLEGGE